MGATWTLGNPLSRKEIEALPHGTKLIVYFRDTATYVTRNTKALQEIVGSGDVSLRKVTFTPRGCFHVIIGQNHVGANQIRYICWDAITTELAVFLATPAKEDFKTLCERIKNKYKDKNNN